MNKVSQITIKEEVITFKEVNAISLTIDAETAYALVIIMGGYVHGKESGFSGRIYDLYKSIIKEFPHFANILCHDSAYVDSSNENGITFKDVMRNCSMYLS